MDFVDLSRPPAACLPPVLRTGAPSRTFATTLPTLFGEGRRLAETRAPRRVKLLLEPSRAALPAIPVALGARQILAQPRVLTLQDDREHASTDFRHRHPTDTGGSTARYARPGFAARRPGSRGLRLRTPGRRPRGESTRQPASPRALSSSTGVARTRRWHGPRWSVSGRGDGATSASRAIRARPPETASTDPGAVRPVRCIPSTQSGYCRASRSATRPVPSGESSSTIRTWQPWGEHARDQHRQVVPFVEGRDDDEDHHAPYDLRRSGGFGFDGLQRSVPEQRYSTPSIRYSTSAGTMMSGRSKCGT